MNPQQKQWFEKNWFENSKTASEYRKAYKKLMMEYHPDKYHGIDADKVSAFITSQYKSISDNLTNDNLERIDFVLYANVKNSLNRKDLEKKTVAEKEQFIEKNYCNIDLTNDGKLSENNKPIMDMFATKIVEKYTQKGTIIAKVNKLFLETRGETQEFVYSKSRSKFEETSARIISAMNSINCLFKDILEQQDSNEKRKEIATNLTRGFHIYKLIGEAKLKVKINELNDKKEVISTKEVEPENLAKEPKITKAIVNGFADRNIVNKKQVFYNLLTDKPEDFTLQNINNVLLTNTLKNNLKEDELISRVNTLADATIRGFTPVQGKRLRNRDCFDDYFDLYEAAKEANGGKVNEKVAERILKEMEDIRIHNIRLEGRGFEKDYISQQKRMDAIYLDLGKEPLEKWKNVANHERYDIKVKREKINVSEADHNFEKLSTEPVKVNKEVKMLDKAK